MRSLFLLLMLACPACFAQVRTLQLDSFSGPPPGNSIGAFINHRSPENITAFISGTVYNSSDSGKTWKAKKIPVAEDVKQFQVDADPKGTLYYFYTSAENEDRIFFSKSTDNGEEWSDVGAVVNGKGKDEHLSVSGSPRKDALMFTWTQSEEIQGLGCVSNVYGVISTSGGKKWGEPILINSASGDCLGKGKTLRAAAPLVGRDGKVFVVWAGDEKIFIDRSYDGGNFWLKTDLPIGAQPGGWNIIVPDAKGVLGMPALAIDNSEFRSIGTIYLAYADQTNGATDTDIWLLRSPNHGDNWTYPERVNLDETGKYQYSPRVAVDQGTGFVYIVFFDRRNYDDARSDVYLAWSGDAGGKFKEVKVNDTPIEPGDTPALLSVNSHKGVVVVMWSTTVSGQTVVKAAIAQQNDFK